MNASLTRSGGGQRPFFVPARSGKTKPEPPLPKNTIPMKPLRVSIRDPESPRMKALNGGAAASGTLYTYPDNFRCV